MKRPWYKRLWNKILIWYGIRDAPEPFEWFRCPEETETEVLPVVLIQQVQSAVYEQPDRHTEPMRPLRPIRLRKIHTFEMPAMPTSESDKWTVV